MIRSITVHRVARRDLADLQVAARRHMRVAAGGHVGEVGDAGELPRIEDAVVDAHPAHERILRRRDVEQTVIFPPERVGGLRELILRRLLFQPRVGVERMLLALPFLRVDELLAGGLGLGLRGEVRRVGTARRRGASRPAGPAGRLEAPDLDARGEPFEETLLLGREITAHGLSFNWSSAGRRTRGSPDPPVGAKRVAPLRPELRSIVRTAPPMVPGSVLGRRARSDSMPAALRAGTILQEACRSRAAGLCCSAGRRLPVLSPLGAQDQRVALPGRGTSRAARRGTIMRLHRAAVCAIRVRRGSADARMRV